LLRRFRSSSFACIWQTAMPSTIVTADRTEPKNALTVDADSALALLVRPHGCR